MKQLVINGHLTSTTDCDKGDCIPSIADGDVGWTSRMIKPEGAGTGAASGGYNHQMLK